MMQRLNRNQRNLLWSLVALVLICCFWMCVFRQQLAELKALNTRLEAAETRLQQQRVEPESLTLLEAAAVEAEARLLGLQERFSRDLRDGSVVADIGIAASRAGVTVHSLRPGSVNQKEHYLELPLEIKVRGDYERVLEFFRQIENLVIALEIRRLEVKALPQPEGYAVSPSASDGRVQADFTLVFYAAPTAEHAAKPEVINRWRVGRQNIYDAKGITAPYPEQ
jgi:type IV pilus assembly protein PilO